MSKGVDKVVLAQKSKDNGQGYGKCLFSTQLHFVLSLVVAILGDDKEVRKKQIVIGGTCKGLNGVWNLKNCTIGKQGGKVRSV